MLLPPALNLAFSGALSLTPDMLSPKPSSAWTNAECVLGNRNGGLESSGMCAPRAGTPFSQGMTQKERQELLWNDFVSNPSDWWDNRAGKKSPNHPDFRHKTSKEPLWINQHEKPTWLDTQLAGAYGAGVDDGDESLMVEALSKQCEEAELSEAVEALGLLVERGCRVGRTLFYRVLKRCMVHRDLSYGRRVHYLALVSGHGSNAFLANHIIGMYACHGKLDDAAQAFRKVAMPSVHMWSSIILAHARHGQPGKAMEFYRQMRGSGVEADSHIFVAALTACAFSEDLVSGKEVHADVRASAVKGDIFVGSSLVNMYAKCGSLDDARKVFDSLAKRNVVTWTAMIAGYSKQGLGREALALYASMEQEGLNVGDRVTFVCLLQACASVGALQQGKKLHSQIRGRGLEGDGLIGNSLVNMYAKCGSFEDARNVFDNVPRKDVVTWNAMIAGYSQQGLGREALAMYERMQQEGITVANNLTFVAILQACASVGAIEQGKQLHSRIRAAGLEGDLFIGSSLVDMYAKCGWLTHAKDVFASLPRRDAVTWNALLNGYAEHSDGHSAIRCFEDMVHQGVQPDETTFTCLLVACSHAGLVHEGQHYFSRMVEDYKIVPTAYHHGCMVDLLARSGQLDEAEHLLRTRSVNDVVGWTALLTACQTHSDVERGRRCFERIVKLEPESASSYVMLGNIYANSGRWDDVERIENLRKSAGAMKKAAKACIEVKNEVHEFTVGEDRSDISLKLKTVNMRLKDEGGHVPQTQLVLKALSEQEKEDALCGHAEKLALAYGLLNTPDGSTLLVTKNLRMCNDCHSSTKVMSRLEKREIIVRDAHCVHRFVEGSCSCRGRH